MKSLRTLRRIVSGAFVLAVFAIAPAAAQSPPSPGNPPPPTATQPDPRPCADPHQLPRSENGKPPEKGEKPGTTGRAPTLSEQLAEGEGVLCPPKTGDSEMVAPAPDVGTTPVIPPPGTPGGDPTVRPK